MKKILLATSALVASASFAAADVSISGFAEMGIADTGDGNVQMHNDIDVTFKLSGETDGGLSFGATIDLDEVTNTGDDDGIPTDYNDSSVFISGAFGTLTMGDTDGALDWAVTEAIIGDTIQDDLEHSGYNGNSGLDGEGDGQVLRYDYSFGAVGLAISAEQDANGASGDDVFGVGVKYATEMSGTSVAFGVGYQDDGVVDQTTASVKIGMDAITAILNYSDHSVDGSHTGVALGYTTGALTLGANWGDYSDLDESGYGVAVNYDLGGGAVVQVGYGNSDVAGVSTDTWSAGIAMSF